MNYELGLTTTIYQIHQLTTAIVGVVTRLKTQFQVPNEEFESCVVKPNQY